MNNTSKIKVILHFIRRSLISGIIDWSGEFFASETGAPRGGVLSPFLVMSTYMNWVKNYIREVIASYDTLMISSFTSKANELENV